MSEIKFDRKKIESLYESSKMTSIKEYTDEKIILQTKKWQDPWMISWWEFVTSIMIFMIRNNISDLHIEANNSIVYRIRYRKNKKLYILKFSEIEKYMIEFFEEKWINKEAYKTIIEKYKLLFLNDEIEINYEQNDILNKLKESWILNDDQNEDEFNFNEKKFKLSNLKVINEAFVSLFSLIDVEINQDTSIDLIYDKIKYSYRIAMKRQSIEVDWFWFYSWVIRLLMTKFFSLRELWINEYEEFIRSKILLKKLNIIWWETNSWKSTTIFSLLKEVYDSNNWQIKLYTVEEPIEKQLWFLTQLEIKEVSDNKWSNFSFKDAERFLMRADPDWVLIWEIRDNETANTALKFAVTWHYTYATLHIWNVFDVKKRFEWWWISSDSLNSIWFVEVTELVPLYRNTKENLVYKLSEVIKSVNESEFEKYFQVLNLPFEEQKNWYKQINQLELKKFKFLINWNKIIRDLFIYRNEIKNEKLKMLIWAKDAAEYNLKQIYFKFLKFLPSYFANIYLDSENINTKKSINTFLNWYFEKENMLNISLDELLNNNLLFSNKDNNERIKEIKKVLEEFIKYLNWNKKLKNKAKILENTKLFLLWQYKSDSWTNFTIFFNDFINFMLEQFIVLWNDTSWITPIVEFYDYEEVWYIEKWLKEVIFKSSVFTPMFLFWLTKTQKINSKDSKKIINFVDILKMFSTNYWLEESSTNDTNWLINILKIFFNKLIEKIK